MPKITQAKPGPAANGRAGAGLLSRFGSVRDRDHKRLQISIYGHPKTGKTRLLSSFPKPIAIIGGEDGTKSISDVDGIDFVRVIFDSADPPEDGNYVRLGELGRLAEELPGSGYATVAVDTADSIGEMYLASVLGLESIPVQKSWGMATLKDYGQRSIKLRTFLQGILRHKGHVCVIAHEGTVAGGDEDGTANIITPAVGSAIGKGPCTWLNGQVDYVVQCFKRRKMAVKKIKVDNSVKEVSKDTGQIEYCLRTGNHPIYMTGFRCPVSTDLPDVIVDPTFEKIAALAYGEVEG